MGLFQRWLASKHGNEEAPFARLARSWKAGHPIDELHRQVDHWRSQTELWRQTADLAKRQWEECENQLAHTRAVVLDLEGRQATTREAARQLERRCLELEGKIRDLEQTSLTTQPDEAPSASIARLNTRVQELLETNRRSHEQQREIATKLEEAERQRDEANWYLGEAHAQILELEGRSRAMQVAEQHSQAQRDELASQLQEAECQRDEANWYFGEVRAEIEQLLLRLRSLEEAALLADRRCAELTAALADTERQRLDAAAQLEGGRALIQELEQKIQTLESETRRSMPQQEENRPSGEAAPRPEFAAFFGEAIHASIRRLEGALGELQESTRLSEERYTWLAATLQQAEQPQVAGRWDDRARAIEFTISRETKERSEEMTKFRRELAETRARVTEVEAHVAAERTSHKALEAELAALRAQGERRRTIRFESPDVIVELRGPGGTMLFRGVPRNVSRTGFTFATDQPLRGVPEQLQAAFHCLGLDHPTDAIARVVWQQQDVVADHHLVVCELVDPPSELREALEQALHLAR